MLNVAIAVDSATDYGPRAVRVVAAACEEVIGEGRCPVASDLEPGAVAAWYAVVHPNDPELSSLRIEFRDRTADGVLIEERSLSFSARDSAKSRLASAGSVIAALAAAREGSIAYAPPRKAEVEPVPATLPPPAPEPPPAWPPAAPADWSVDLAGLIAPTFGDGPSRFGALARLQLGISEHFFGLVSGRYAAHASNPSFAWYTAAVGVGSRFGERAATFNVEVTAEGVFERTTFAAERGAERQSAGQSGWGGRVGVNAVWATFAHSALVLGVDGSLVVPRINVIVAEQDATRVPLASLSLMLGVRFKP